MATRSSSLPRLSTPDHHSASGKADTQLERVKSFSKLFRSPSGSPYSKPKGSSSSSSPWARFNPARIFRKSGKHSSSEFEGGNVKVDDKMEEKDKSFTQPASEVVQPILLKMKEEAVKAAKPKDSSSDTDELASKVEQVAEKVMENLKEKGSESQPAGKIKDSELDGSLGDYLHSEKTPGKSDDVSEKKVQGTNTKQSPVTNEEKTPKQEDEDKKEDNCVSSLAQGLRTFCAPRSTHKED